MSAISIADLNNAQLDVNHIAAITASSALTITDRFGNTKKTLAGIEFDAAARLASLGYMPPVAYAAGLSMTVANQTVSYQSNAYAPIVTTLPFTTSGTFEAANFRLIQGVVAADLAGPGGAALIGSIQAISGAILRTIQQRSEDAVNAREFGVVGNGADDTAALAKVKNAAMAGHFIRLTKGVYRTSQPLNFTGVVNIIADPGTRIVLTAAAPYVAQIDLTNGGAFHGYGASLENIVFDGGGFCADGLVLKGVVASKFNNIRATNVTGTGLHLAWAQCCLFTNYICSNNVEAFTTTPINGVLVDGQTSSANTFINIVVEHVTGSGVKALSLINTTFMNGTSEGCNIGLEFGAAVSVGQTCLGNTIIGMDLEANAVADIVLRATASGNTFIGLCAGYASPAVQVLGSVGNSFYGGVTSGFNFDVDSHDNTVDGVKLLGVGAGINNAGTRNVWRGVYNISTASVIRDSVARGTKVGNVGNGGTLAIDAATTRAVVGVATGPAYTVGSPTNAVDGMELDVTVRNESLGATSISWAAAYKIAGWVDPANGFSRTARFVYNATYSAWYLVGVNAADVPN